MSLDAATAILDRIRECRSTVPLDEDKEAELLVELEAAEAHLDDEEREKLKALVLERAWP